MRRHPTVFGLIALFVALPLAPVVIWAFATKWRFPALLPGGWSLRGWDAAAAMGGEVPMATANSAAIALAVVVVTLSIAVPAGLALGRFRFRGRGALVMLMLLPILVPPLAATLGIDMTFIRLGLVDTLAGVCLVHLIATVPYATLIMAAIFSGRGDEPEQTARTLGATAVQAFWHITLPDALPGIAVAGFLAFLISWGQYILTVLIGGGIIVTLPMLLFAAAQGSDPVVSAVLGLVFAAPAVAALVVALLFLQPNDGQRLLRLGR